jgi:hypothetical protein
MRENELICPVLGSERIWSSLNKNAEVIVLMSFRCPSGSPKTYERSESLRRCPQIEPFASK